MELERSNANGYYCPTDPGEPHWNAPRLSINDTEAKLLKELFYKRTVLEIGTGLGVSTRAIASVADRVYTVDIDYWVQLTVVPTLPENVVFYSNYDRIPVCEAAFIDGYHEYNQCRADIQTCKRLVMKGGMMVFHDLAMGAIRKALVDEGYNDAVQILTKAGIGVCWNE